MNHRGVNSPSVGEAAADFASAAMKVPEALWTEGRPGGKWSPAEITEHLALSFSFSSDLLTAPPRSRLPAPFRSLMRRLFLDPMINAGKFRPGTPAPKHLWPSGPGRNKVEGLRRLTLAVERFVEAVTDAKRRGVESVGHPLFGDVALDRYCRLQAIHTIHHQGQLSGLAEVGSD